MAKKNATKNVATVTVNVDNFNITMLAGDPAADAARAAVQRNTANPWVPVAKYLAEQESACFLVITRNANVDAKTAKSPLSRINSAITRYRMAGGKNALKLDSRSGAEKGIWLFIRRV